MNNVRIKRIYDFPSSEDGYRILVDRLWPSCHCSETVAGTAIERLTA